MKTIALLALALSHPAAFAGDFGASGGGEFIRDQYNPWFLKGVSEVRYCLKVDRSGFSASPAKIAELTARALDYWKNELGPRATDIGLGTQKFTLIKTCAGDEDLTVQFGYGTLDKTQQDLFANAQEDPLDYVGIALRTSYDKVNLRGKGFILVASDLGAPDHIYNHGKGVVPGLWSYDGMLFRILQHELGHVFGVAHTEEGFMSAYFPENMLANYREYRTVTTAPFFEPPFSLDTCQEEGCARIETNDGWSSVRLSRYDAGRGLTPLGTLTGPTRSGARVRFPVKIFLPAEQTVFKEPGTTVYLKGPGRQEYKLTGSLVSPAGDKKPALLELWPEGGEAYFDDGKGFQKH